MNFTLYINGKKRRFTFDAGWYSGSDVTLFRLELFSFFEFDTRGVDLISLQFLKFTVSVSMYEVSE